MSANNNCTFMGRLTADPELRSTQNGKKFCTFTLAVSGRSKDDDTTFVNFTSWEKQAEFIAQYFTKGSRMLVNGELRSRSYTDKEGNKRNTFEVRVGDVTFCESKGGGNTSSTGSSYGKSTTDTIPRNTKVEIVELSASDVDGDLPF